VFDTLIESKRKTDKKRLFGVGFVSVVIHTVLIGAAIVATVKAGQSDTKVHADTAMVFLEQQQKPPEQQPVQLDVPLKGFQTIIAPTEIPTNIPPINLTEHFDVKDYSGSGVEGGVGDGVVPAGSASLRAAGCASAPSSTASRATRRSKSRGSVEAVSSVPSALQSSIPPISR